MVFKKRPAAIILVGLLSSVMMVNTWAQAPKASFYRYINKLGEQEVGRHVPPDAVAHGYEILDSRMRLIDVVKPAPTKDELAKKLKAQEQAEADELLLQTFSTYEDAVRARDRKLSALDVIVTISEGNILRMNLEYESLAETAASRQRRGQEVPQQILDNMASIERQIQDAHEHIRLKELEKETIIDAYQPDIDRLKQLQGVETPTAEPDQTAANGVR